MAQPLLGFLAFAVGTVVVLTVPVLAIWLLVQVLRGLGFALGGGARLVAGTVRHVATFAVSEVRDTVQFAGGVLTLGLILPLGLASVALLRFRAAKHYAGAIEDEFTGALASLYRVGLGNPARFLGLGGLTDGIERRIPEIVAREPRTGKATRAAMGSRKGRRGEEVIAFEGYTVQEELQAGGSGARLFCAVPTDARAKELERRGLSVPQRVVIKAFDLGYGSTIPQIVRESRSLESAKNLGLILEHELGDGSFHYVMPFVPGEDLDQVIRRMHSMSGPQGLSDKDFRAVIGFTRDLCDQLGRFHGEGLWHKDIKPSNLLVAGGRLQVVDFGLVTPLESALTLTTHGTEFFRDPELVRLALAGRRVKDVDGVKFDLYSAGAVLYSMIENSFPAHGSLSSISKRTPEALRWIVRRAMADVDKRYASAEEMAKDVDVLVLAADPFQVRPADLPSVSGQDRSASRAGAFAAGKAPREEASFAGTPEQEEDIQRIRAFGMTAEIRGLGRAKETLAKAAQSHTRGARKARREAAAEEKRRSAAAAKAARTEAKQERRSQRRGLLRAGLTLAVFGGIVGGIASVEANHGRSARVAASARASHVSGHGTSHQVSAEDGLRSALAFLTEDDMEGRYLEAAERAVNPKGQLGSTATDAPTRRLHPSIERELANLGPMARVLILTDPGDSSLSAEARMTARRMRALGAIPLGVNRRGEMERGDTVLPLLGKARYELDRAQGSLDEGRSRLAKLAAESSDMEAIFWLRRQPRTGYVRTLLASGGSAARAQGAASCDESCDKSCDKSDACESEQAACATTSSACGEARVSQ